MDFFLDLQSGTLDLNPGANVCHQTNQGLQLIKILMMRQRLVVNEEDMGNLLSLSQKPITQGLVMGLIVGEAANIATPEWLRVAKDAAIRRASINYPPMVSHFQLLYDLALALHSRLDTLDPALLWPGRLDCKVEFDLPDLESRTQIFKIHTQTMNCERDI